MAKKITILTSKGGSGKTTTAVNLSAALATQGKRCLLVDLDPQCSCSDWLGYTDAEEQSFILDALLGNADISDGIQQTYLDNLHLLPCSMHLFQAETHLSNEIANDTLLSMALESVDEQYDYIVIDVTPTMGVLAYNAIYAAKNLLIPVETSYIAMRAIRSIMKVVELMQQRRDDSISIVGLLASRVDVRQTSCKQALELLDNHFSNILLNTFINDAVAVKDSVAYGQSVICYKPKSKSAKQFLDLAIEIDKRLTKSVKGKRNAA
jgi:chromosome partitioning protein